MSKSLKIATTVSLKLKATHTNHVNQHNLRQLNTTCWIVPPSPDVLVLVAPSPKLTDVALYWSSLSSEILKRQEQMQIFDTASPLQACFSFQNRHLFYTQMGDFKHTGGLHFSSYLPHYFCVGNNKKSNVFNLVFLLFCFLENEKCARTKHQSFFLSLSNTAAAAAARVQRRVL